MAEITLKQAQEQVDSWIKTYGVRYFNELTNMTILTEEVGELARIMARNGCSREEAVSRIRAQMPDVEKEKFSSRIITNSDEKPIIPQILSALATL